ncbi:MAG: hypothetical protein H6915_01555 [Novosphingobium sp.]|nr:hypothetical protein [Novosphingobium sp.]MCP5388428.1 hypothetical protein [Novosphingobium sp.]
MLDHLVGLLLRALNAQVTGAKPLQVHGKLLGHADVRTTTRYAHLDDGHVIEAAQRIGDLIEQSMSGSYSLSCNTKYDSWPLLHD